MNDDTKGILAFLFFAFFVFVAVLSLMAVGAGRERHDWQSEAIARGVAGYDEKTGSGSGPLKGRWRNEG